MNSASASARYCPMCLITPQLLLAFTGTTHEDIPRLALSGYLVKYQDFTLLTVSQLLIEVQTVLSWFVCFTVLLCIVCLLYRMRVQLLEKVVQT